MQGVKYIMRSRSAWCEALFCLALLAVFLPFKIYPLVFLAASVFFAADTKVWTLQRWAMYLAIFTGYAVAVFLIGLPVGQPELTNFLKLLINFTFLYTAVTWLVPRNNVRLLGWV